MAWFFRVVELDNGLWACRQGMHEYDTHTALESAIGHIKAIAARHSPAALYLHLRSGTVQSLGTL